MAAKLQHTPGPWRYQRTNGSPTHGMHMIAGAKPGYLAEVRDCGSGDVSANGKLIAASPVMLSALLEVETYLAEREDVIDGDYGQPAPNAEMTLLQEVRAAITKALGNE